MTESRISSLWEFILTKNKLDEENRPSVLNNFDLLVKIIDDYDLNFEQIMNSPKKSEEHKQLLKKEDELHKEGIRIRKLLNIYIYDPNPKESGRAFVVQTIRDRFPIIK